MKGVLRIIIMQCKHTCTYNNKQAKITN